MCQTDLINFHREADKLKGNNVFEIGSCLQQLAKNSKSVRAFQDVTLSELVVLMMSSALTLIKRVIFKDLTFSSKFSC